MCLQELAHCLEPSSGPEGRSSTSRRFGKIGSDSDWRQGKASLLQQVSCF